MRLSSHQLGWALFGLIVIWLVLLGSPFDLYIAGLVMIYAVSTLGQARIPRSAAQTFRISRTRTRW